VMGLFGLLALLGSGALGNDFVTDDRNLFVRQTHHRDWGGLRAIWTVGSTRLMGATVAAADTYRPLTLSTFTVDHQLWGPRPAGFHATSLALHLLVCVLLWAWLDRLVGRGPALLGTFFFGVHPAAAEAWVWINGRSDLLAGLMLLVTLRAFDGTPRQKAWGLLAALAACLSKEMALLALPFLAIRPRWPHESSDVPPARWRPLPLIAGLAFVASIYVAMRTSALAGFKAGPPGEALARVFGRGGALAVDGLASVFVPRHFALRPLREELDALSLTWRIAAGAVTCGLLAFAWWQRRRRPALAWGLAAFVTSMIPNALAVSFGHGRYLYGPLLLLLPGLIDGARSLAARALAAVPPHRGRRLLGALLMVHLGSLAMGLLVVQRIYADEITLFSSTVKEHPHRAFGWGGLGSAYLELGAIDDARAPLRRAHALDPGDRRWKRALDRLAEIEGSAAETKPAGP
jgi:protein O-mannosyl-transferase